MIRISILAAIAVLHLATASHAQAPSPVATVHLKIFLALNGDDLGAPKVILFKSRQDGQDYAKKFRDGTISNIAYGVYDLRAYQDGFEVVERREILVYRPEVWVVMGTQIGRIDFEPDRFRLSGTVRPLPSTGQPVWVRLTSIYSNLLMDAKVDKSGVFEMAGLKRDKCVLTVWSGTRILEVRPVDISSDRAVSVILSHVKDER